MSDLPKVGGALPSLEEEAAIVVEEELEVAPAPEPVVEEKPKSKKSSAKFDKHGRKILGKTI
jgi:hypothetical protein